MNDMKILDKEISNKASQFLISLLNSSFTWKEQKEELQRLEKSGLINFLAEKLLSRQYRKSSVSNSFVDQLVTKLRYCINGQLPIHLILPFGGYKLNNARKAEWAEFFNISMLCEYAGPIIKLYPPGLIIEYSSDGKALGRINNINPIDIDDYNNSFNTLISEFQKYLPHNLSIKYQMTHEFYDDFESFLAEVDEYSEIMFREWFSTMPVLEQDKLIQKASRNYQWNGKVDYNHISNEEKRSRLIKSLCQHQAYIRLDDERRYEHIQGNYHIPISTRKGYEGYLHLGSCKSSVVQFWVGQGILDMNNDIPVPRIISKTRQESTKLTTIECDVLGMAEYQSVSIII